MASLFELKDLKEQLKTKKQISTSNENFNRPLRKRDIIKQRIWHILSNSSVNGLPNLVKASNIFLKIMWSISLIISTCVGSYYTIDSIIDFFKYNSVTIIDVIHEQQSQFPTISFCPYPEFNGSIDQMIISANFERIPITNFSQFEEFEDHSYGKCFRYNSGFSTHGEKFSLLNSSKSGFSFSLRFNIHMEVPDNYDFGEFLVNIHNYSSPPYDIQDGGYWVRPGSWNYFEVERIFTTQLEEPYNNCLKNVSLFKMNKTLIDKMLKSKLAYSQTDCLRLCSNLLVLEESNCGCNSSLENFEKNCVSLDVQFGQSTDTAKCCLEFLKEFPKNFLLTKCYKYCPSECDSLSYNIKVSTEPLPDNGNISKFFKNEYPYLQRYNTYQEVNRHFIAVRVFYKDLKYTLISQAPKTETFNFVSNIGGLFGLFLGLSFLSFIEILEILSEAFSILVSNSNSVFNITFVI